MNELQQRQHDDNQRLIKERQEQQEFEEKKRQGEEARHDEKAQLDKKVSDDKKLDQKPGIDESKRFDDKRRDDKKLDDQHRSVDEAKRFDDKRREDKKLDEQRREGAKSTSKVDQAVNPGAVDSGVEEKSMAKDANQKPTVTASQTPFAAPENKPSFAAPKPEDPRLAKPTTLAERTAIRNMDKSIENERAGRTSPSAHTVERAEQAEAKLQQAQEANASKTKKTEHHKSATVEKTL